MMLRDLEWLVEGTPALVPQPTTAVVICGDIDGSRIFNTYFSKSERGKQILYTNAYMWSLEKWYG